MPATVTAEYQERARIVFTARGRSFVNVREVRGDAGPLGFTSTELLLIALGNCSLGVLLNAEPLREAPVARATATLTAELSPSPPVHVTAIGIEILLEVDDASLLTRAAEFEAISCACPMCNTVSATAALTTRVRLVRGEGAR